MEKEDLQLLAEWLNNPDFLGEYDILTQVSKAELEKPDDNSPSEKWTWFFIEKKDCTKIGKIGHKERNEGQELGFAVLPNERNEGYCSEAVTIMTDYLFLSKDIVRIQARSDVRNAACKRVLEKNGFKNEGVVRKGSFIRGEYRDLFLYSILREEWKEPKILTKNTKL